MSSETHASKLKSRRDKEYPVALITGAGRGIGRATAEAFTGVGYAVAIAELLAGLGRRTVRALVEGGAKAAFIQTDVAGLSTVQHTVKAVLRRFGRIDCLVNNAGILRVGSLTHLSIRDLDRILAVNLRGPLILARAVLPIMARQGEGVIINVASQLGKTGLGGYVAYCASKFGVVGFTEALASEVQGTGVQVWAVCPGLTDTPMAGLSGVSVRERRHLIRPERVARTILDLAMGRRREPSGTAVDVL